MIRAAILLGLAAVAPIESRAQIPDIKAMPHQLRTMTPPQLGAMLFGKDSPPFSDAWVQGPTLEWRAIEIDLATTPKPTGYGGLCSLTIGAAYFRWAPGARGEDKPVQLSMTPWTRNAYVLTDDRPSLKPVAGDDGCAERIPYSTDSMRPTIFHVMDAIESDEFNFATSPNASVARFALASLVAAQEAAKHLPVKAERCIYGFSAVPASCGDPAAFVRSFYMRQILWVTVSRCKRGQTLCIDGAIQVLSGSHVDHVVIETGETTIDGAASPRVRSISVRAGSDPIYD